MTPEQYLDYLIESATMFEEDRTSIAVKSSELKTLKALLESENARSERRVFYIDLNANGNPT